MFVFDYYYYYLYYYYHYYFNVISIYDIVLILTYEAPYLYPSNSYPISQSGWKVSEQLCGIWLLTGFKDDIFLFIFL